jgi:hypothetical protein
MDNRSLFPVGLIYLFAAPPLAAIRTFEIKSIIGTTEKASSNNGSSNRSFQGMRVNLSRKGVEDCMDTGAWYSHCVESGPGQITDSVLERETAVS